MWGASVVEQESRTPASARSGWLPGLVLGAVDAFALLETGVIGLGITVLTVALLAWKGPRFIATAGLVTGLGAVWTLLFGRVLLSCTPAESCDARGIGAWVMVAAAILAVGVGGSIVAVRRAR
jgi:hypothetical protein